jgi:type I restriction enzyme M protein
MEHLTLDGRAGVIVPEGIIFQSGSAYKALRKKLVTGKLPLGSGFPAGRVFNPYSGVKTSILLIDRQIAKRSDRIIFLKIENDGYNLGAQRRQIEANDLPEAAKQAASYKQAVMMHKEYETPDKGVILVEKAKLAESGDYNLSAERYSLTVSQNTEFTFMEIGAVCDLYQPVTISAKEMIDNGEYPVFGANGIIGRYNQYNHIEDEVVITCRGATCGTVNMTLPKSWITGNAMVAHPKTTDLNKKYLFYLLSFPISLLPLQGLLNHKLLGHHYLLTKSPFHPYQSKRR